MYKHPFTRHACVDEKKFIADYANCNPEPLRMQIFLHLSLPFLLHCISRFFSRSYSFFLTFVAWIVALITVAVTMTIGFATLYLALKNDPAEHH